MRPWLITDTHFGHGAMVELCGRPYDFDSIIVRNIQRLLNPQKDFLIHLGDVGVCKKAVLLTYLDMLATRGIRMILVRGNHDHESDSWYMNHGFAMVCQSMVFRNVLLTHAPANELPANAVMNVHGHMHNRGHHEGGLQPWHKLLAIEGTKYAPVLWDKWVGPAPLILLA